MKEHVANDDSNFQIDASTVAYVLH